MPKGKRPHKNINIEEEEEEENQDEEVMLVDKSKKPEAAGKRKRTDAEAPAKTQKSTDSQSAAEVENEKRMKEEALKKAEEEKHQKALSYLREHAHSNLTPFMKDIGDGRWIHNLFTSVPTNLIFVRAQGEGKDRYLQARYWKDSDQKRHVGLTKFTLPVYVTMAISAGHGSYNPENKYADEYFKAKYVVFVSNELTASFEEDLDKGWTPKSEDERPPHELWKDAIVGFFEDLIEKQERLIDEMYYSDVAANKRNEYIKQYTRTTDVRLQQKDERYKGVEKGSEAYKKIIDDDARAAFSAAAYRFVTRGDDGLYELRAKRPTFAKMTAKQKAEWKVLIDQLKKSGNRIEASEEHKPFFEFLDRQPLQVAGIDGVMLPRPKNWKTPQVLKGMYCMLKISLNPFVQDQNHGISAKLARWPGEPEIIIYRKSDAVETQKMALPQFKAAEAVKPSYQVQEPDEDNSCDAWLKKLNYMMESRGQQKQIEG